MARTGEMLYGPEETPVHSSDGISGVTIRRDENEVFRPDTILSLVGKSVTDDHPMENVDTTNWHEHEKGQVISARRGEGVAADLLLGDIIIKDPVTIQKVLDGKIEVSCGYDADYEELKPGLGRQKNIFYNHLALVDKGRCGPRCAIGDYQPEELDDMAKSAIRVKNRDTLMARIKALCGTTVRDADIQKAIEEETTNDDVSVDPGVSGMGEVHIHMGGGPGGGKGASADDLPGADPAGDPDPAAAGKMEPAVEARFQGLEAAVKQIAAAVQKLLPAEEENAEANELVEEAPDNVDEKTVVGAKDSAFYSDSYSETAALAEIIAPGVKVPTFDSAAKPGKTVKMLCSFRRTVLDLAWNNAETRGDLQEIVGSQTFDAKDAKCHTCDKIRNTFRSLALLRRSRNNGGGTVDRPVVPGTGGAVSSKSGIGSIADLNKRNRERHSRKTA
jgi:hypothetical protein